MGKYMLHQWFISISLVLVISFSLYISIQVYSINCDIRPLSNSKGYVINTEGCMIPKLDTCDPSILSYIYEIDKFDCNKTPLSNMTWSTNMVYSNLSTISLNKTAALIMGLNTSDISCLYCPFSKTFPIERKTKQCHVLNISADIKEDYVTVYCNYSTDQEKNGQYQNIFTFLHTTKSNSNTNHQMNVLVVGLDGLSRLNFHRNMPLTSRVMKRLQAIEFMGYNKVGENSHPNLMPVLTGLSEQELINTCLNLTKFYDNCSLVWNAFKDRGYTTMYAEDAWFFPLFGRIGGYNFSKKPTDYYWSPFLTLSAEIHRIYKCFGVRSIFKLSLDYTFTFAKEMTHRNESFFGFVWTETGSHRDLNTAQLADADLALLMTKLVQSSVINHTVLILMSDHGVRYGDMRRTPQGSIEDQLPLLYIYLPIWFRTNYRNAYLNMLENTRKLTTHYDLHETLLDLADLSKIYRKPQYPAVGFSLFNYIPENRTCRDARISPQFCACHDNVILVVGDDLAAKIADYVASQWCGKSYSVGRILQFRKHIYINQSSNNFEDFTILFNACSDLLEATVRKIERNRGHDLILMDKVSKLNKCEYC